METVLGVIVILFVILLYAALARAACVAGKVAGAFVELVLGEAEKRRPKQYKVKRNYAMVLPFNCPECGVMMTHIVCGKCGNWYSEVGNCPHCRQRVKAISCPCCGTVINL